MECHLKIIDTAANVSDIICLFNVRFDKMFCAQIGKNLRHSQPVQCAHKTSQNKELKSHRT